MNNASATRINLKRPRNNDNPKSVKKSDASIDLPILAYKKELLSIISSRSTTIVVGETGSGKSTQLPQYISAAYKNGCVVCTQPRRVAAVTIAQRVAEEQHCTVGDEVGYSIRFDDCTSHRTRIKYVTDGVLLREMISDHNLSRYNVVILDEAHERSLQTDILMGLLRRLQEIRSDLRVVIMSATLEVDLFMTFFKDPCLVRVEGRQYPVKILYTVKPQQSYVDAAVQTCLQIHEEEEEGGVLVFLPGQDDIESMMILLHEHLPTVALRRHHQDSSNTSTVAVDVTTDSEGVSGADTTTTNQDFDVKPLYASLPPEKQMEALRPPVTVNVGKGQAVRRFILSTNIAETSVTVPGI
eukprot:gene12401-26090_t